MNSTAQILREIADILERKDALIAQQEEIIAMQRELLDMAYGKDAIRQYCKEVEEWKA